jgi:hypothetical protein
MIENGFRRIALAQGLLPEPLPSRDLLGDAAPSATPRLNTVEAADSPVGARDDDWEMPVAGAA